MSSFIVLGLLGLTGGHREFITKPGRNAREIKVYHIYYTTSLQCLNGDSLPGELRVYSPPGDGILSDNTVAFVAAKSAVVPRSNVLLEALYVSPAQGDPDSEGYEDALPDMPIPFISALGHVLGPVTSVEADYKAVALSVNEYVRDQQQTSVLQCALHFFPIIDGHCDFYHGNRCLIDSSKPRWAKTPMPRTNSVLNFFGVCHSIASDGNIRAQVDNLALNVGQPQTGSTLSPLRSPSSLTPIKKRKFGAIAGSSLPTTFPSSASTSQDGANDQLNEAAKEMGYTLSPHDFALPPLINLHVNHSDPQHGGNDSADGTTAEAKPSKGKGKQKA